MSKNFKISYHKVSGGNYRPLAIATISVSDEAFGAELKNYTRRKEEGLISDFTSEQAWHSAACQILRHLKSQNGKHGVEIKKIEEIQQ
jgi:hypothetical protein